MDYWPPVFLYQVASSYHLLPGHLFNRVFFLKHTASINIKNETFYSAYRCATVFYSSGILQMFSY